MRSLIIQFNFKFLPKISFSFLKYIQQKGKPKIPISDLLKGFLKIHSAKYLTVVEPTVTLLFIFRLSSIHLEPDYEEPEKPSKWIYNKKKQKLSFKTFNWYHLVIILSNKWNWSSRYPCRAYFFFRILYYTQSWHLIVGKKSA